MLRGALDKTAISTISDKLPNLDSLLRRRVDLTVSMTRIALDFRNQPTIPIGGVCLCDAIDMLSASRFALFESYAHQLWYRQYATDVDNPELGALWYGRFFADDAALRLCVVVEYLADAIINLLELDIEKLKPYARGRAGHSTMIGEYLKKELPAHQITQWVEKLATSPEWKWTYKYRGDWVHKQPPLLHGFGLQFDREERWRPATDRDIAAWRDSGVRPKRVMRSQGDTPRYTLDDLLRNAQGALFVGTSTTIALLDFYYSILESKSVNHEKGNNL